MKNLKFINKIIKTDETGRSMVEMLGVLAIVGVISIGGIAGYIYGMNRYRTNEILDGASKRAVLVASQLASEITPNLTEFVDYDETAGGTFSSDVQDWGDEFGIKISGVKKEVCENLIRMIGSNTPLRAITSTSDEKTDLGTGDCVDGTNNNLYLVYNIEMLSNAVVESGGRTSIPGGAECTTDECRNACVSQGGQPVYEFCCKTKNDHPLCCQVLGSDRWSSRDSRCCEASEGYDYNEGDSYCFSCSSGPATNEACCKAADSSYNYISGECCTSYGSNVVTEQATSACCSGSVVNNQCCYDYGDGVMRNVAGIPCS